jgi:hypothetical protein
MKRGTRIITASAFGCTLLLIALLLAARFGVFSAWTERVSGGQRGAGQPEEYTDLDFSSLRVLKGGDEPRISMENGELIVSVLSGDFDGDGAEEQIIAYRDLAAPAAGPPSVSIACIDYDENSGEYVRVADFKTPVTRPGTLALYTQDLIGDHQDCVMVTGMNDQDDRTMSVYRWEPGGASAVKRIAEITSDGSISIQENDRPVAYTQGMTGGQSYAILVRTRDALSGNPLDQIETNWIYNAASGVYERRGAVRLPGARVESRALRDVLSGNARRFEQFAGGLWYHVSASGTIDNEQYMYFDTENREIIFYGDNTQQVYTWRSSSPTRFGIYISSQNISVPTMQRHIDLELESIDSMRVRVFEDVRMRIQINAPWDGSYRKASQQGGAKAAARVDSFIDAVYDCSWGRIRFAPDGVFEIQQTDGNQTGAYAFFALDSHEILELIPRAKPAGKPSERAAGGGGRESYRVERAEGGGVKLYRVRLGTRGIQEYHEAPVTLAPAAGE